MLFLSLFKECGVFIGFFLDYCFICVSIWCGFVAFLNSRGFLVFEVFTVITGDLIRE